MGLMSSIGMAAVQREGVLYEALVRGDIENAASTVATDVGDAVTNL